MNPRFLTWPGLGQAIGHIPEEVRRVAIAAQVASTGDLNPHWFGHPASLLLYTLAGIYKICQAAAQAGLQSRSWLSIRALYLSDPTTMFLIGRVLARLFAAGAIIATFELGSRMMPRRWAFCAAILTAINPSFVMHAHRLRCDHILTLALLVGAAGLSTISHAQNSRLRSYGVTAIAGVAITFKYTAVCILVSELMALGARGPGNRRLLRDLGLVVLVACIATFIASPFLWLDLPSALRDLAYEGRKGSSWNPLNSIKQIVTVLRYSFGDAGFAWIAVVALTSSWQMATGGWKRLIRDAAAATTQTTNAAVLILLTYLGSTILASSWNATWMAPIIPIITLLAVQRAQMILLTSTQPGLAARVPGRLKLYLAIALTSSIVITQVGAYRSIANMRQSVTTIEKAEAWLQEHVQTGSNILLWQPKEGKNAFFPRVRVGSVNLFRVNEAGTTEQVCQGDKGTSFSTSKPLAEESCYPRPRVRQTTDISPANISKADYLILSSRKNLSVTITNKAGDPMKPAAIFQIPNNKFRLSYPSAENFPHGDYGTWMNIEIYRLGY